MQPPPTTGQHSPLDRLRTIPLKIKIVVAVITGAISIFGTVGKVAFERASPAPTGAESTPGARDESAPQPPSDTVRTDGGASSSAAAWLPAVDEACGRAAADYAVAQAQPDFLGALQVARDATTRLARELAAVSPAPAIVGNAASLLETGADRYQFASEMLVVNQQADAVEIAAEGDDYVDNALQALASAGATSCAI